MHTGPVPDNLLIARLHGTARRLVIQKVDHDEAVVELRAITTSVPELSAAAGTFMAGHRADPRLHPFDRDAADLLFAAGADLELAEVEAAAVAERLRVTRQG